MTLDTLPIYALILLSVIILISIWRAFTMVSKAKVALGNATESFKAAFPNVQWGTQDYPFGEGFRCLSGKGADVEITIESSVRGLRVFWQIDMVTPVFTGTQCVRVSGANRDPVEAFKSVLRRSGNLDGFQKVCENLDVIDSPAKLHAWLRCHYPEYRWSMNDDSVHSETFPRIQFDAEFWADAVADESGYDVSIQVDWVDWYDGVEFDFSADGLHQWLGDRFYGKPWIYWRASDMGGGMSIAPTPAGGVLVSGKGAVIRLSAEDLKVKPSWE